MRSLRDTLASAWEALNPAEPSPSYLATFMAVAAILFLAALAVRLG